MARDTKRVGYPKNIFKDIKLRIMIIKVFIFGYLYNQGQSQKSFIGG